MISKWNLNYLVHETTLATIVSFGAGAVDEILFREGDELAGGLCVLTLKRAGGGESPAGSALTLVLDGGDESLLPPVDGRGDVTEHGLLIEKLSGTDDVGGVESQTLEGLEFLVGEIGEPV